MITVFQWVGFIFCAGVLAAGSVGVWWLAVKYALQCAKETWWIVAWKMHKIGNGPDAKLALEKAIRTDNLKAEGRDEEAAKVDRFFRS